MGLEYGTLPLEALDSIRPLWEGLNVAHGACSVHFAARYQGLTFAARMAPIREKALHGRVRLDVLRETADGHLAGYCLSSVAGASGEVDSIFIEAAHRGVGHGDRLMRRALEWFATLGVSDIGVSVVYANDAALPFYRRHGFFPAMHLLRRKG
ncbi:GNAT family N-acetyltransferase [Solidesulfovibrio sp.]|uniref:GNAT family N-acetyltransferase n=1 Tax=Solidesulfovibrio sp. TaxID=2910990 RepID=UPI002B205A60|nr:GNAT family N-acetyltransferase [Solidesulfovibrio sp.]MEA5090466.1 GNAT family N-acetyltransferase [Solidesulfovibrio sp.]